MVLPGFKTGPGSLLKRYGDHERQLYQATLDAVTLAETIRVNQIDCQYEQTGQLYLGHKPALVRHLEEEAHPLSQQLERHRGEWALPDRRLLIPGEALVSTGGGLVLRGVRRFVRRRSPSA